MPPSPTTQQNPLDNLNKRELRFVFFYHETLQGTQSAIAAGYSEKTAHASASRLLKRPDVKAAILWRREMADRASNITKDSLRADLLRIATADIEELYDFEEVPVVLPDGSQAKDSHGRPLTTSRPALQPLNKMLPSERKNIVELRFDGDGRIRTIKLADKLRAYDMLLKSGGHYINLHLHDHRHEHSVDRLKRARKQAGKLAELRRHEKQQRLQRQADAQTIDAVPVEARGDSHN